MTEVISPGASRTDAPGVERRTDRAAALRARFRQTRQYQVAAAVPAAGGLYLLAHARRLSVDIGLAPIVLGALSLLAVAVLFSWINWRCPACRRRLPLRWNPDPCAGCGFVLLRRR